VNLCARPAARDLNPTHAPLDLGDLGIEPRQTTSRVGLGWLGIRRQIVTRAAEAGERLGRPVDAQQTQGDVATHAGSIGARPHLLDRLPMRQRLCPPVSAQIQPGALDQLIE